VRATCLDAAPPVPSARADMRRRLCGRRGERETPSLGCREKSHARANENAARLQTDPATANEKRANLVQSKRESKSESKQRFGFKRKDRHGTTRDSKGHPTAFKRTPCRLRDVK
jgi:hypothetical protein